MTPAVPLRAPADLGSRRPRPDSGFLDALRAEWTKTRTLSGTGWLLAAAVVLMVAGTTTPPAAEIP